MDFCFFAATVSTQATRTKLKVWNTTRTALNTPMLAAFLLFLGSWLESRLSRPPRKKIPAASMSTPLWRLLLVNMRVIQPHKCEKKILKKDSPLCSDFGLAPIAQIKQIGHRLFNIWVSCTTSSTRCHLVCTFIWLIATPSFSNLRVLRLGVQFNSKDIFCDDWWKN